MSEPGLVDVADYATEDKAADAARQLLERGIGPDVVFEAHDGGINPMTATEGRYVLRVLATDEARAREVLDLPPAEADAASKGPVAEVAGWRPPPDDSVSAAKTDGRSGGPVTKDEPEVHSLLGGRIEATTRQIVLALAVYLTALILIPLAAFCGTRWALESDPEVPVTTLPALESL